MNENSFKPQEKEPDMADKATRLAFTEKSLQRWRMIQIISLLPLLVSVVLMLYFKGSMLGTIVFFLVLIVGVVLPQICRNVIESHLILLEEIESLRKEITRRQ
jgi:hypothetical protein